MRKIILIILCFVFFLNIAPAFSAQACITDSVSSDAYYLPTTVRATYTNGTSDYSRLNNSTKFTSDGIANYPYEIYLPNEQSPENYRIHTNYTKNTDACASCHSTHTAVGDSLLQWYSVYETCLACHDGTVTTTYDVISGKIKGSAVAFGGAFGNTHQGSDSSHNVVGAVNASAAPGGSTTAQNLDGANKPLDWEIQFGCESCHSPHGLGGNARILSPDPNFAASARAKAKGYSVYGMLASADGANTYSVKTGLSVDAVMDAVYDGYYFINGYPYNISIAVGISETVYTQNQNVFTIDNSLGYTRVTIVDAAVKTLLQNKIRIIGVPSLKVRMNISNYLQVNENVQHASGMNVFCGACHTDYNTANTDTYVNSGAKNGEFSGSANQETGVYSKAHRHQVGFQWEAAVPGLVFENQQLGSGADLAKQYGMECLTCHVAHGTNLDFWKATLTDAGKPWAGSPDSELVEAEGSSALKRMPNMATCEACHQKGVANEGYLANTAQSYTVSQTTYNGMFAQEDPNSADEADFGYGTEAQCAKCHPREYNAMTTGDNASHIHNMAEFRCSRCHGVMINHLKAPSALNISNPRNYPPSEFFERMDCSDWCHSIDPEISGGLATGIVLGEFQASGHWKSGKLTCATCHDLHALKLKKPIQQICGSCHGKSYNIEIYKKADGEYDHHFGS